jgi:hypothetical protein
MIKRLEQVTALVVAAGLAVVSYWLFFSWAGGGGGINRPSQPRRPVSQPVSQLVSQSAPRLEQPLLAGGIIERAEMALHVLGTDRQSAGIAQLNNSGQGSLGVLKGLTEQGLGEFVVGADMGVESRRVP